MYFPPPCGEGLRVGGVSTLQRAKGLRRSMTQGEKRFWSRLRTLRQSHGMHIRRQAPMGVYVADFAIHRAKLIIEVDGEHHQAMAQKALDKKRDAWFASQGYRTLRFSTGDLISNMDGCVAAVLDAAAPSSQAPSYAGMGNSIALNPVSGDPT